MGQSYPYHAHSARKSRPRLLAWSLLPQETATLIRRCQQAQTSVHAAICAAFLLAIAQSGRSQDNTEAQTTEQQPVTLKCLTPINIRRFLTPPIQEDFGYYYIIYTSAHPITSNLSLWDLAHAIKAQLNQKMSLDQIFAHLPEAQAFITTRPSAAVVKEVFEDLYPYDVLVSNFGRLHIPTQYGHLHLEAVYGPSLMTHFSNDPPFVGVATLGDQIFFNLVYSESHTSLTQIKHLQQEAMRLLY